jgi:glycosyltransferase involved in cell wall biosynthesis
METSGQARRPRILWVAYVFPPVGGTQGLRMQRYLQEITRADPAIAIDVLTIHQAAANPQFDRMLGLPGADGVRVHRVRPGVLHRLRYRWRLDQRCLGRGPATAAAANTIRLSNLGWLPRGAFWLAAGRTRRRYDAVYVFVDPFASLILGLVAALLNPRARLMLEYGDPRIPVRHRRLPLSRAGSVLERRALHRSCVAVFRTWGAVRAYQDHYPSVAAGTFTVLYGGVDWEPYDAVPAALGGPPNFSIVYTGTLYADSVDPEPFFRAVARVAAAQEDGSISVRMVGAESPAVSRLVRELSLEGLVTVAGHVPASEVIPIQRSAALLLAFGTRTHYKISSKLAQYIAARVPILYVTELADDPGAELVSRTRRGPVVPNEAGAIAAAILEARRAWLSGDLGARFDLSRTGEFSWQQVGSEVGTLLTGAARDRPA